MDINNLCMGCMKEMAQDSAFCPRCGHKANSVNSSRGLQPRSILNGKYLVGKIIGEGGFGITYIAYDLILNSRVAIKEYFPSELVTRDTSTGIQTSLTILTNAKEEQYKAGIERFVQEARNLAKFNNLEGIVSVKEFFYENNTAYMVMEYIEGITLSKYLEKHGNKIPYDQVIKMMTPVMDSLEKIHAGSIVHRDISPDNIMVSDNGMVKLIDFGAARIVDNTNQKSLTVILKHGYAPEEQYQSHGNQGPWTDIYALSATMYRMITGIVPQESTDRVLSGDKVVPINKRVPEVPKRISDAIMHGLAVKASNRPQTISDFRSEMEKGHKNFLPIIIAGIAAMVLITGIAGLVTIFSLVKKTPKIENSEPKHTVTETETKKPEEPSFVETSEIPEVKILTEEEKQALWREYQDKIMNVLDINPGDDRLHGYFDDYDGDGDYELFMGVGTYVLSNVLYADANGVLIESYDWENDAHSFIKADQSSEDIAWLKEFLNDVLYSNSEEDAYSRDDYRESVFDFPMRVSSPFGKQKMCYYDYFMAGDAYGCYTVWNGEPKFYQERMTDFEGITFGQRESRVMYFTSMGAELQIGEFYENYSPYYVESKFGELASVRLDNSQPDSIMGLSAQITSASEYIKNHVNCNYYGGNLGSDIFKINDAKVDSILYNDAGYFIINYKCFCTFEEVNHADWTLGTPYYVSMAADEMEDYIDISYTGKPENMSVDTIDGIYSYAIIKYDGNTYTLIDSGPGYIGESVTDNVLATSKCPYID